MTEFFQAGCFIYILSLSMVSISPQFATEKFSCNNTTSQQTLLSQACCDEASEKDFEDLCLNLFTKDFGYTLIGIKPVSTYELPKKYYTTSGKKCLFRLKKIFDESPNFVLKILPEGPFCSVELLNKKSLRNLVKKTLSCNHLLEKTFTAMMIFIQKWKNLPEAFIGF